MSVLGKTFYEKIGFEKEETQNFIEDPLIVLTPKIWKNEEKKLYYFQHHKLKIRIELSKNDVD